MAFVIDADVLSTFAKIKRLDILAKVFGKSELLICPAVVSDLEHSKSQLVREVAASRLFNRIALSKQENNLVEKIYLRKNLGMGETECIAVCKIRSAILITNDRKAIELAEVLGVDIIDLETILYSLKDLVDKNQLKQIIADIESKDRVIIVNKDKILKYNKNVS